MIPNKKALEIVLSALRGFEKPIPELEQYETPSEIAADLLWNAFMDGKIEDKKVCDLGCGTGILSIGASLMGAERVLGFDIDKKALEIAHKNIEIIKETIVPTKGIKFVEKDITDVKEKYDTVIMNPPFGVQKEHADRVFLEKAFSIANSVYTIHKSGSDVFLIKFAQDNGFLAMKLGIYRFILKKNNETSWKSKVSSKS